MSAPEGQLSVPQAAPKDEGRILTAMFNDLITWATTQTPKGLVFWAKDPIEPLAILLGSRSEGWRAIMHSDNDAACDQEVQALVCEYHLKVIVESGEGLRTDRSVLGIQGETNRPSLLAVAAAVRFRILCWRFDTSLIHRGKLFYENKSPYMLPNGDPMAAYVLGFHWRAAAAAPLTANEVNITIT